jgi:hypothetical protein
VDKMELFKKQEIKIKVTDKILKYSTFKLKAFSTNDIEIFYNRLERSKKISSSLITTLILKLDFSVKEQKIVFENAK